MDEKKILEVLRAGKARALHVAELCTLLGIDKSERRELHAVLERMAEENLVTQLPGGRFRIGARKPEKARREDSAEASPERSGMLGKLSMHPRGFGFVATQEPGPDVFIAAPDLEGAMHGDRVRIRARPSRQGFEGQVIEVVERAHKIVGGTLQITGARAWLEPDDNRIRGPLPIREALPEGAESGLSVVGEILRYPTHAEDVATVRIIDMLSSARVAEFEVNKILLRENISETFPADVLSQASQIPAEVPEKDKLGREDLRDLALCTIDPFDARDHDDAVWAERNDSGYRVVVAIADVSHYVQVGTAIDMEALARGCTIYLPQRAIPMLPRELSSNLASLLPNTDRLTLAVDMQVGRDGVVRAKRYVEGVMRSPAKLTYEGVAQALGFAPELPVQPETAPHMETLRTLAEVSEILHRKRQQRGSLELSVAEAKVKLDPETSNPVGVERTRKNPGIAKAYNLIEELMLLANETVAEDLARRGVPVMYRVHGAPDPERIEAFTEVANALGYPLDPEEATNPMHLAAFLRKIEGSPQAGTLGYLLLRALQQATYSTTNIGHFGLGARDYVHFTSPIRRYPDLTVHRVVRALARGEAKHFDELKRTLEIQALASSQLERRAMKVEREVVDLYRTLLMRDRIGDRFEGTITGIAEHGLFVSLDDPFVEALVRYTSLGAERFMQDTHGLRVTGERSGRRFGLGDRVTLEIEDVNVGRRQVSALIVGESMPAPKPKRGEGGGAGPRRGERKQGRAPRGFKEGDGRKRGGSASDAGKGAKKSKGKPGKAKAKAGGAKRGKAKPGKKRKR